MIVGVSNFRNHVKVVPDSTFFFSYEVARVDLTIKERWWKPKKKVSVSIKKDFFYWKLADIILPPRIDSKIKLMVGTNLQKGDVPTILLD